MRPLLALDTSSPTASVAVLDADTGEVRAERAAPSGGRPADHLAATVAAVLRLAGLRPPELWAVAVGTGPGPFTALRAGIVTATALARTLDVPVAGVGSLDALALAVHDAGGPARLVVATDARRREVYWAAYDGAARVDGPAVGPAAAVPLAGRPVAGRGAVLYPEALGVAVSTVLDPPAGAVGRLAVADLAAATPGPVVPQYLRRPDAREPGPGKRVGGRVDGRVAVPGVSHRA